MLILTRKPEQGIVIDGTIRVRILAVDGDRVKIGIEAPDQIGVLREELAEQVAGANREAVTGAQAGQNRQIARRLQGLDEQHPAGGTRQRRAAH
jgi:carbon storage regulator